MNVQRLPPRLAAGQVGAVTRSLAEVSSLGVSFVRASIDWQGLQPGPPRRGTRSYDFDALDSWVTVVSANKLRWDVLGAGSPSPQWALDPAALASGCGLVSPPRPEPYAAMMAAVARRYGAGGSFWSEHRELPYEPVTTYEIWNEPNLSSFWCPRPDPPAYARLYLAAHKAILAVDPKATVVLGGLADFRVNQPTQAPLKMAVGDFLAGMLAAKPRVRDSIDAVGVHPYGRTPGGVLTAAAWFRATLTRVGLGDVPMIANEFGWPTRGRSPLYPAVPEATRAKYLPAATTALARSNCGLIGVAPHTWISEQRSPVYTVDWYGLANPGTGQPYPSALAYGRAVKAAEKGAAGGGTADC